MFSTECGPSGSIQRTRTPGWDTERGWDSNSGQDLLDAPRLLVGDAATADGVGDLPGGSGRHLLPAGNLFELCERSSGFGLASGVCRQRTVVTTSSMTGSTGLRRTRPVRRAVDAAPPDAAPAGHRHGWMVFVAEAAKTSRRADLIRRLTSAPMSGHTDPARTRLSQRRAILPSQTLPGRHGRRSKTALGSLRLMPVPCPPCR